MGAGGGRCPRVRGAGRTAKAPAGHPWFARVDAVLAALAERGEVGERRAKLLRDARGRVLDLGPGTGENLKHDAEAVTAVITAEPDPTVRRLAGRRVRACSRPVHAVAAAGERIPLADRSVDTVVATLVFCSVADPDAVAAEPQRVLRPGGRLLVLEHVRATGGALARRQDRLARSWATLAGRCRPDRDTAAVLARHGLDTGRLRRFPLSMSLPLVRPHLEGGVRLR